MKKTTVILIIVCVAGLSLLLYPTLSNYWNSIHSTRAISEYVEMINDIDEEKYKETWLNATQYNKDILKREDPYVLTAEMRKRYNENLDVTGRGVMGYIEIDKIGVSLPIYHGVSERVLQSSIGHIDWTSLPTGGESTHCVVSGHRGLPNAKLFTDLNMLREGDTFVVTVLNEVLTYQVDQIRTVLPDDTTYLMIEEGKDYFTLLTCTPYGINTHRLLVRGHRIENTDAGATVVSEAVLIDQIIVASFLAIPLLFILFLLIMFKKPNGKPKANNKKKIKRRVKE